MYSNFLQIVSVLPTHKSGKLYLIYEHPIFQEWNPLQAHTDCLEMRGLPRIYAKVGLRVTGAETQKFKPATKARFSFTCILLILTKLWVHHLSVTHKYQMRTARGNQEKNCGAYSEKICKFPLPSTLFPCFSPGKLDAFSAAQHYFKIEQIKFNHILKNEKIVSNKTFSSKSLRSF